MEPRIVEREAFFLLGLLTHGDPDKINFQAIWADHFMPYDEQIKPISLDGAYYGAWFGDPDGPSYLAGMRVSPDAPVPEGLVLREVPAAAYAVFTCTQETMGSTYPFIWGQWLPASEYVADAGKSDFEQYAPPDAQGAMEITIWIPVVRKESVPS